MAVMFPPPAYEEPGVLAPFYGVLEPLYHGEWAAIINYRNVAFLASAVSFVAIGMLIKPRDCPECPPCPKCEPCYCPPGSDSGWTLVALFGVYEIGKIGIKLGQLLIERMYPPEHPPGLLHRLWNVIW